MNRQCGLTVAAALVLACIGYWNYHKNFRDETTSFESVSFAPEALLPLVIGEAFTNGMGMKMAWIPAGSFEMGAPPKLSRIYSNAAPRHLRTFRQGFWIGTCEVTRAQYAKIYGSAPGNRSDSRLPVDEVSRSDAGAFCRKLTDQERRAGRLPKAWYYRLPSEAEWEYAAAGAGASGIPDAAVLLGKKLDPKLTAIAWFKENSGERLHPVGGKMPNKWGLYDMLGNVSEWCLDRWHPNYKGAPTDGRPWKSGWEAAKVCRGGNAKSSSITCLVFDRARSMRHSARHGYPLKGFRCVVSWRRP